MPIYKALSKTRFSDAIAWRRKNIGIFATLLAMGVEQQHLALHRERADVRRVFGRAQPASQRGAPSRCRSPLAHPVMQFMGACLP